MVENELVGIDNKGDDYSGKRKRKRESVKAVEEPYDAVKQHRKKRKESRDAEEGKSEKKPKKSKKKDTAHIQDESDAFLLLDSKANNDAESGSGAQMKNHSQPVEQMSEVRKKRNKDRKKSTLDDSQGPDSITTSINPGSVSMAENRGNPDPDNEGGIADMSKPKKKRKIAERPVAENKEPKKKSKRKHPVVEDVATETAVTSMTQQDDEKAPRKKKKRKHEAANDAQDDASERAELSTSHKKSRKKASYKDSEYPDPSIDAALTDAARRALSYIHARVSSQPDWKFNKARQNWVLRNVWDDNAIPEMYFPSCVKYLAGVQGNTRELLVQSSTELIESPSKPKLKDTIDDPAGVQPEDQKHDENVAGEESPEEQERIQLMKTERARTLLSTLLTDVENAS